MLHNSLCSIGISAVVAEVFLIAVMAKMTVVQIQLGSDAVFLPTFLYTGKAAWGKSLLA